MSEAIIDTRSDTAALSEIEMTLEGVVLTNLAQAWRVAQLIASAGAVPRGLNDPKKVVVALMAGAEAGLPAIATMKYTMVLNGVPSLYGDGPIALVLRSGKMKAQRYGYEGTGDARFAWYESERRDVEGVIRREYSVADAKRAGLWGKAGPWVNHPDRMLFIRARAFVLRDLYSDVLAGFSIAEEVQEYAPAADPKVGSAGLLAALKDPEPAEDAVWEDVAASVSQRDGSLFPEASA